MPLMPITKRQRQVANRIVLGHSNAFIAAQLGVTKGTVRDHAQYLRFLTGSATRYQLWKWLWAHPEFLNEVRC